MSDETTESVTLKVPPPAEVVPVEEAPESPETTESAPAAPEGEPQPDGASGIPQDPTDPAAGAEEGTEEEAPAAPVVDTSPSGQTVTFPDGRVVYTRSTDAPVSNAEWREYEKTHQGDQLRYQFVPGDKDYSPYSDPAVPNSHLARMVESEIAGYAERVALDPNTQVSYIWNALHGMHEGELDRAIATGGGSGKAMA